MPSYTLSSTCRKSSRAGRELLLRTLGRLRASGRAQLGPNTVLGYLAMICCLFCQWRMHMGPLVFADLLCKRLIELTATKLS